MSILSDEQYAEYVRLLRAWVEADRDSRTDPAASAHAREAYAAVRDFRDRYGLDQPLREAVAVEEGGLPAGRQAP